MWSEIKLYFEITSLHQPAITYILNDESECNAQINYFK